MAIAHTITEQESSFGIAFEGAYWRIITIVVSRNEDAIPKFLVTLDLVAYATNTPTVNTTSVGSKRFVAPWDDVHAQSGDSFIDKAYNYVMAQDEMEGSTAA